MSNDSSFNPALPPIPFINDPLMDVIKGGGDDNKENAKIQAQIDALKKADAKLDEKMAKMQHEKQFDQALGAINNQLISMGKSPVQAENPFRSMPQQTAAGANVSAPTASAARPAATTNFASVGGGGGVGKV